LDCEYPYLILDARYEKVRENAETSKAALPISILLAFLGWTS